MQLRAIFYKQIIHLLLLSTGVIINFVNAAELNSLNFLTESYPPYNFEENGQLKGVGVDLLISASNKANSPISANAIKLQPWARAYREALKQPGTVLFSTTKTAEREPLFKWVGPISSTRIVALAKKSSGITIQRDTDLKQHDILAIRDDVGEQLLISAGVPKGKIKLGTNAESIIKRLQSDRVKIWVYEENVARWFLKQSGLNSADYEVVHVLTESEVYYAFNQSVDDSLVKKLQDAIEQVKSEKAENGKTIYENILAKYN
ncbi:substrate-binding periplasmic protein [Aliikangiella maris]|uniref:Transporter substrate-binding domain-containing protein n=2 Tax=Aliikangiella maris TaxID=3162458 RepID=A0ABV2BZE5_9GAMM